MPDATSRLECRQAFADVATINWHCASGVASYSSYGEERLIFYQTGQQDAVCPSRRASQNSSAKVHVRHRIELGECPLQLYTITHWEIANDPVADE